jgi:hypothetical protein
MGLLQKIFRRGSDEAEAAETTAAPAPKADILSEAQERAREVLERELREKNAKQGESDN